MPVQSRSIRKSILSAVAKAMVIGIKAGRRPHRTIAVWSVVVRNRIFIRSWSVKPSGWYFVFKREKTGELHVANRTLKIRPAFIRSKEINDIVSRAYAEKYHTPGSRRYVKDLSGPKSRRTTTELVPLTK